MSPDRSGRDWQLFLADMREFCRRIAHYIEGRSQEELFAEQMRLDAVLRNLELLGEQGLLEVMLDALQWPVPATPAAAAVP